VELKSTGRRPLKVTGLTLSGLMTTQAYGFNFPQDFILPTEASPWTIGAGEVKQIPVIFNPSAAGTSHAIMTYYGDGSICDRNIDTLEGIADPSLSVAQDAIAGGLRIESNHPNPFSDRTTISFSLPRAARATLGIYSADGVRVATLVDGQLEPGEHRAVWDATGLPSGLYYCRIEAGGVSRIHTLMLVR
jgi:hypothetical protein